MMTDEIVSLRLDWQTVCRLACKAYCLGLTFDQVCELAIDERLASLKP